MSSEATAPTAVPTETPKVSLLGRELAKAILTQEDMVIEPVYIPEWPAVNGHLYVRSLRGIEREQYMKSIRRTVGKGQNATVEIILQHASAKLVVAAACDKNGQKVFSEADVEDLSKKNAKALERIVEHAGRLNGLSEDSLEEEKNASAETTASASSSS